MKQQQLTFEKGITNVPSDPICSDNALKDAVGMIFDKGEHRVIQSPVTKYALGVDTALIKFVHKFNNEERIIRAYTFNNSLEWYVEGGIPGTLMTWAGEDVNITAIGKTLIISDDNGLHYFLWNNNGYKSLGSEIPSPDVEFKLDNTSSVLKEVAVSGLIDYTAASPTYVITDQDGWFNAIIGAHSYCKENISLLKSFHGSFCVRVALELFDGTYYKISNPVFMLNRFADPGTEIITGDDESAKLTASLEGQDLYYKINSDYSDWADIVKDIVIFTTPQADIFETRKPKGTISELTDYYGTPRYYRIVDNTISASSSTIASGSNLYGVFDINQSAFSDTVKNATYFRLCPIGIMTTNSFASINPLIDVTTLSTITSQEQLGEDDYFSRSKLTAERLYAYNARLNLANVSRGFFGGYDYFMPFTSFDYSYYVFVVDIETNDGTKKIAIQSHTNQKQGIYFYYPDARAKRLSIYKSSTAFSESDETIVIPSGCQIVVDNATLSEHPGFNGAYYFNSGVITASMGEPTAGTTSSQITINLNNGDTEVLSNYILTSEANNPFVFTAKSYFTVGVESIVGMSTITQALSQGQFGQYPLIIFATDGIWSASLNSEGYFSAVHPMSREVCSNNKSITQTDSAIFFVSEKGLMIVSGSDVQCVSEALSGNGEPCTFFAGCVIAYDYRNALLWLLNKDYNFAYTYSLKSGTFGKFSLQYSWGSLPNSSFEGFLPEGASVEDCTVAEFVAEHGISDYELSVLFDKETQLFCTQIDYIESGVEQTAYVSGVDSSYNVGANVLYDKDGKIFFKWNADNELIEVTPCFGTFKGVVNNYPDTYIQIGKKVLSLLEKPQRDEDEIIYPATFTTRPLKLENALALKSIMQMKHISLLNDNATLSVTIEASNNLKDWATITSLRSTPWKYYRFTYNLENLKATDTFSGTVLLTEERRTNKLR